MKKVEKRIAPLVALADMESGCSSDGVVSDALAITQYTAYAKRFAKLGIVKQCAALKPLPQAGA